MDISFAEMAFSRFELNYGLLERGDWNQKDNGVLECSIICIDGSTSVSGTFCVWIEDDKVIANSSIKDEEQSACWRIVDDHLESLMSKGYWVFRITQGELIKTGLGNHPLSDWEDAVEFAEYLCSQYPQETIYICSVWDNGQISLRQWSLE